MNNVKPVHPDKKALKMILGRGSCITIFSPFYSAAGLLLFENILKENNTIKEINFNCRLTKRDWIQGSIDPEALLRTIRKLPSGIKFNVACEDGLHAKAYFSENRGLIGSANLTSRGFGDGLEFLLMMSGDVLNSTKRWFSQQISPFLTKITLRALKYFIEQNKDDVKRERRKIHKVFKKESKRKVATLPCLPIDVFMDFCAESRGPAPKEVVLRFMGKDQLSGHIKNFYYASQQFLNKNESLTKPISKISPTNFRLQNTSFKEAWIKFVKSSKLKDIPSVGFSAQSTLNYLPVRLGGRQTTGGAGIGNLNRVLPLVARFKIAGF